MNTQTEDDLFRVLQRKPMSEIYHLISTADRLTNISRAELKAIVNECGYSLQEFIDYDDLFTLRSKE